MRLDAYLVETDHFKSRARAKKAILDGHVKINGSIVTKVSKDVSVEDIIEVAEGLDKPAGYFKLKRIQEETGLIHEGDHVLDLGSSAGGFLLFASEIADNVKGMELSRQFRSELGRLAFENDRISVMFGDVFTVPLGTMSPKPVDVILSDMTLEPPDSLKALERVLPLLKEGGRLLQVIKIKNRQNRKPILGRIESMGVEIIHVMESEKEEIYIVAQKTSKSSLRLD
jgi:23S rRNA (cytidine1920-2'-O)/16S rRNA (cytidine1409-2'-O)-methyltransferase